MHVLNDCVFVNKRAVFSQSVHSGLHLPMIHWRRGRKRSWYISIINWFWYCIAVDEKAKNGKSHV